MKVKGTILVLAVVVLLVSFSAGEKIGSNAAPLSSIHPHAKVGCAITAHADSNTKVGQVLCADGSICDYNKRGSKTPVALVVYVGSDTGNSKYHKGLAMALNDCSEGTQWGPFGYENPKCSFPLTSISGEDGSCYRNGKYTEIEGLFSAFTVSVYGNPAAPDNTSGWFLPSAYQINTAIQSLKEKSMALNSCFSPIGGTNMWSWYWTCTEYDRNNAIFYKTSGSVGHQSKITEYHTRAMLVF
jgi:hypothetical protein